MLINYIDIYKILLRREDDIFNLITENKQKTEWTFLPYRIIYSMFYLAIALLIGIFTMITYIPF